MATFAPKKALLNPKFEGYKLHALSQDDCVTRSPLKHQPTQATASGKTLLSLQEMRSRITHNHLAIEPERRRGLYVDAEGNVCLLEFELAEGDKIVPTVQIIYQLPTPIETEEASSSSGYGSQREYPSAAFLGPSCVFVADGLGALYVLPIRDTTAGNSPYPTDPVAIFTLTPEGPTEVPFRLHSVHRASPTQALVLLSARYYPQGAPTKATNAQFEVYSAKIDILSFRSPSAISQPRPLDIVWRRRGSDIPFYTSFVSDVDAWVILSGSTYLDPDAPPKEPPKRYEPTPDEIAPIPRIGENLDNPSSNPDQPPKPHPYSWTQTGDSLTVAFPLPSTANKNDIKVIFTTQTLTIHIQPSVQPAAPDIPIPHYSAKLLWDTVNSSSCFWTWDKEGDRRYGLLTCHMDKRHEGTKWPQVFSTVKARDGTVEEEAEVPESLDPSELYQIRESLEKYTSALVTGEDASGLGLGRGVPSLAGGEMDDEADAAVGRASFVSWVSAAGQDVHFHKDAVDQAAKMSFDVEEEGDEIKVLSTLLPGSSFDPETPSTSIVLKRELDGLLYTLTTESTTSTADWVHENTFPALAFVLASKRDTRFTYHLPPLPGSPASLKPSVVLAFESGTLSGNPYGRGGNVYVYHAPQKAKDIWAKQSLLRVGDGPGGALMGVGCLYLGRDGEPKKRVVICLTEGALVLIKNL